MARAIENWSMCNGRYRIHSVKPVRCQPERIVEIELNSAERAMFEKSAQAVQSLIDACKRIAPDLGK